LPYSHKQFTFKSIVAYDKTVVGSIGSSSQEFEEALRLLPQLNVDAYLQRILPLDQFRKGWEDVRQRAYLKVLLEVGRPLAG
jgi:D-arabinose 1-dehydrogenase-like Zn-dependent alcohol dehydrogenase